MRSYGRRLWSGTGEITKATDKADGSIEVEGICSSPTRDNDGEVIPTATMASAVRVFLKSFPSLRVMHQPIAAGKVTEAETTDDGKTRIRATVVDRDAVLKVKTGVLRAFSIGGRVTRRDPGDRSIIRGLVLREISLVDTPAHPEAVIEAYKAAQAREAAERLAKGNAQAAAEADPEADEAAQPGDTATCEKCGTGLACPKCSPVPQADAEKLLKLSGAIVERDATIARLQAERDSAVTKAVKSTAIADADRARLLKVAAERDTFRKAALERDDFAKRAKWAEAELARRPRGVTRAIAVEKADDVAGLAPGEQHQPHPEPEDAMAAIKKAHRQPRRLGDLGARR